jgi:hypothetical protein
MFQKSIAQEDMFKSASRVMEGRTRKLYEDECGWHNQLRLHVTNLQYADPQRTGPVEHRRGAAGRIHVLPVAAAG